MTTTPIHGTRAAALTIAAGLVLTGCTEPAPEPPPAARNLLLISVDTLRPDHLEAYGYARPTSPRLKQLASEAVVFERAYASSSWTLPSMVSLLTAQYPVTHGCESYKSKLAPGIPTLAEFLHQADFHSGAVTSHVFVSARYGLHRGFADFDQELVKASLRDAHRAVTSPEITRRGLAWLGGRDADERWFLWLHYFDPHHLYLAHDEVGAEFRGEEEIDLYDGEIAFTDRHLGELLDGLAALGFADNTLVVFVADHGEEFGEHGGRRHHNTLYEEVLRVPLIVRLPGAAPRRVAEPVSVVDVLPTALELLGLETPRPVAGISLAPALQGRALPPERPLLSELHSDPADFEGSAPIDMEAVVAGDWKLVRDHVAGRVELFDLARDPGEQRDERAREPERASALEALLDSETERASALNKRTVRPERLELSPEEIERLRALGYGGDDEER